MDEAKLWDGLSEILDDGQPSRNDDDEDEEEGVYLYYTLASLVEKRSSTNPFVCMWKKCVLVMGRGY